jgi:hypothetical protein
MSASKRSILNSVTIIFAVMMSVGMVLTSLNGNTGFGLFNKIFLSCRERASRSSVRAGSTDHGTSQSKVYQILVPDYR